MTDRPLPVLRPVLRAVIAALATLFAGVAMPANAQNFENLDRLDSLVAMSVGANRGEPGGPIAPIDRRLRLAPCPQQPTVDMNQINAATVSCTAIGWRIRVPLAPGQQAGQQAGQPIGAQPARVAVSRASAPAPQSSMVVVKKGDPVQLIAGNDEFSISRFMIADEDGAMGALIRVRQDPRSTPIFARVEALGVVRIPGI